MALWIRVTKAFKASAIFPYLVPAFRSEALTGEERVLDIRKRGWTPKSYHWSLPIRGRDLHIRIHVKVCRHERIYHRSQPDSHPPLTWL